jgi:ABC-2 type transport system ATP-binding protein
MLKDKAVTIRHLRKNYPGGFALDVDELHVDRGEVFALLGPNGAGKTTLTEILSGLRDRDSGEAEVLGGDPGKADNAWRARVGVVLQDSQDYARLTVQEVLSHFAGLYPGARDPRELAEAVGLGPQWNRRAVQLSGGQRRRLDVALGLVGRPELLFLDEPTTGFDPEVRAQFWELIASLGEEGTTIVLTTHYLDEVERLADRVAVLSKGRIADVDTPSRLGGRHLADAVVGWRDPDGHHWVESANPTATVVELAGRYDGDIPMLTVRHPSLEDVYLKMIGESA